MLRHMPELPTLEEYAKREGISYTAACARARKGKITTKWGKRPIVRWQKVRFVIDGPGVK